MGSSKHRALYDCTGHTPMNLSWLPPISSVDSYSSENGRPVFLKHFSWSPVCSSILIAQYTSFSSESETVTQLCLTLVTPWTIDLACQALLSIEFSRQEFWSGLPRPSPGDFPNPGSEPRSPALQADSLLSELPVELVISQTQNQRNVFQSIQASCTLS